MSEQTNAARLRELNDTIRYTMWSVFRAAEPLPALRDDLAAEADALVRATWRPRTWSCGGRTTSPPCAPTPT